MEFKTPLKKPRERKIEIPPSPCLKKIGYGTGVAVYEFQRSPVRDTLRSPWALKKLLQRSKQNKELDKRLKDEATILRNLNHKNIIGFRAFIQQAGSNILAMEECNKSLGDAIEERFENTEQPFPAKTILKVASDISDALKYLHDEALLLHCDIKSYNILVKGDFIICKLCDFGVCLSLNEDGTVDKKNLSSDVDYMGTLTWCPPEILTYPQIITSKADIYSFGLVIWEMIALIPPIINDSSFNADTSVSVELDESMEKRKRPDLPSDVELGDAYNFVLELYFICTQEDFTKRPEARILCQIIEDSQKL